jgi:hypothetical protein
MSSFLPASQEKLYRVSASPDAARGSMSVCFSVPASSDDQAIERGLKFIRDAESPDYDFDSEEDDSYQIYSSMKFYVNNPDELRIHIQNGPDDIGPAQLEALRRTYYDCGAIDAEEMIHQALADKVAEVAASDDPQSLIPEVNGMQKWFESQPADIALDYCGVSSEKAFAPEQVPGEDPPALSELKPRKGEALKDWHDRSGDWFNVGFSGELYDAVRDRLYKAAGYSPCGYPPEANSPEPEL